MCPRLPGPLERFSRELYQNQFITLANYKGQKKFNEPIKARRSYDTKREERVSTNTSFISDWMTKWREIYKPIVEHRNAKPRPFRNSIENRSIAVKSHNT